MRRSAVLLSNEGPSQGRVRDQACDEAAANRGLDGWSSCNAVGEADDLGYCAQLDCADADHSFRQIGLGGVPVGVDEHSGDFATYAALVQLTPNVLVGDVVDG